MLKKISLYCVMALCLFFNRLITNDGIAPVVGMAILIAWIGLDNLSWIYPQKIKVISLCRKIFFSMLVVVLVLMPLIHRMIEKTQDNDTWAHDGFLQTEYALDLLSKGRNLYSEDVPVGAFGMRGTYITFTEKGGEKVKKLNPAHFHYVYPPLFTLESFPLYQLLNNTVHWFDQRLISLMYLTLIILFLACLPIEEDLKYTAIFLILLNPFGLNFFLEGRNDIVVYYWILASFVCLQQEKMKWAIFSMTVACLMKQTAWVCLPFTYLYLYHYWKLPLVKFIKKSLFETLPAIIFASLVMVPFLIWDFQGLWSDLILYPAGKLGMESYPVNGYSLLSWMMKANFQSYLGRPLHSIFDAYPTLILQLPVYALTFFWSHRVLQKKNSLSLCLFQMSLVLTLFSFLSRFYHDNYIELNLRLFVLSGLFYLVEKKTISLFPSGFEDPVGKFFRRS